MTSRCFCALSKHALTALHPRSSPVQAGSTSNQSTSGAHAHSCGIDANSTYNSGRCIGERNFTKCPTRYRAAVCKLAEATRWQVSHEVLLHEEKHFKTRSDMTNLLQSQQVIVAFAAFALAAVCYQYSELMGVGASGIRDKSMVSAGLSDMRVSPVIHQTSTYTQSFNHNVCRGISKQEFCMM
jgi:hypothetical protein